MGRRIAAIVLLAGILSTPVLAQRLRFTHLTSDDGLSRSWVTAITQDSPGFLWIGTAGGLNRYDGYRFTLYEHDPRDSTSIANSYIRCLYVDRRGTLWVGTDAGLSRYLPAQDAFHNYRPGDGTGFQGGAVQDLIEDARGSLWVASTNGLYRFDPEREAFAHYAADPESPTGLSHTDVRALLIDSRGNFWVATAGGLDRFDPATGVFEHFRHNPRDPRSLPHDVLFDLVEDAHGHLWVSTDGGGLGRLDLDHIAQGFKRYRHDPHNPHRRVRPCFLTCTMISRKSLLLVRSSAHPCGTGLSPSGEGLFSYVSVGLAFDAAAVRAFGHAGGDGFQHSAPDRAGPVRGASFQAMIIGPVVELAEGIERRVGRHVHRL